MQKLKAYFFLILIIGVQFGSTGCTYYVNECSTSGRTSVTFTYMGCQCSHDVYNSAERTNQIPSVNQRCCSSIEHFIDTANDFPNASFVVNLRSFTLFPIVDCFSGVQELKSEQFSTQLRPNPPPWQDYHRLVYIQSFLI